MYKYFQEDSEDEEKGVGQRKPVFDLSRVSNQAVLDYFKEADKIKKEIRDKRIEEQRRKIQERQAEPKRRKKITKMSLDKETLPSVLKKQEERLSIDLQLAIRKILLDNDNNNEKVVEIKNMNETDIRSLLEELQDTINKGKTNRSIFLTLFWLITLKPSSPHTPLLKTIINSLDTQNKPILTRNYIQFIKHVSKVYLS